MSEVAEQLAITCRELGSKVCELSSELRVSRCDNDLLKNQLETSKVLRTRAEEESAHSRWQRDEADKLAEARLKHIETLRIKLKRAVSLATKKPRPKTRQRSHGVA